MPIEIEVPEQGIVEFPDGMDHDAIKGVLQKKFPPKFQDLSKTEPLTLRPPRVQGPSTTAGGPRAPLASYAETVAEPTEELMQPRIQAPEAKITEQDSPVAVVGKEAWNLAKGLPEFMSSTAGLMGVVGGVGAPTTTTALFAGQMFNDLGQQVVSTYKNWGQMSRNQKIKAVVDMVGTGAMGGLLAKHATTGVLDATVPARALAKEIGRSEVALPPVEPEAAKGPVGAEIQAGERAPAPPMVTPRDLTPQSEAAAVAAPPGMVGEPTTKLSPQAEAAIQEIVPAIKTMSGEVVAGEKGQSHNDIIEQNKIPAKEVDRREFVDTATGQEVSREKLATAIPTKKEGEAHSSDLAKAQEAAKVESVPDVDVKEGDTIQWEPSEKERRYQGAVGGIVQDVIHNTEGDIGFNIFAPTSGDPTRVVRVWANRGKVVSRKPAQVAAPTTGTPEGASSTVSAGRTPPRPKTIVEIADEIAAKGVDPQASYGLFVKARDLKPEIDAKEWLPIYRKSLELAKLNKQIEISKKAPSPPTPASVKAEPSGAKEPPPKTGENLIIRPRTDGMVSLQDVKGAQIGTFKTLEEAAKWARENGYGIAAGSPLKPKSAEPVKLENQPWKMTRDEFFDEVITGTPIVKTDSGKFFAGWDHAAAKDLAEDNGERISGPLGAAAGWRKFGRNIMASELEMDKNQAHQAIVEEALKAGKPVPREVLADYPDLKPSAPPPPAQPKGETQKIAIATGSHRQVKRLNDAIPSSRGGLPASLGSKTRIWEIDDTPENREIVKRLGLPIRAKETKAIAERKAYLERISKPEPPTPPPVEQKGVEPEKGPGMVGMGGATPQEFEQPGTYVSNMFAAIDRDRAELGKPPMDPTVRRSWGEDNQRALAQMNRDPNWIPNLISEVLKRPRPLLSWENAGLVWQRAFWKTEYNNALKRIAQAFDDNRTEDLTAAKTDAAVFEDKLEELDRAVGRNGTGSEAGRTLQAQKMGAGDDFTLIEMTLQKRAAVGGRRLTAEESANLAKEHARLEALNSELQKELATRDERLAKSEADRAMAELKAKGVPTFDKRILAAAENIVSKMETAADAARERIKARFAQPGAMSGPIDPTLIDDFAVVASAKIARAGLDLAKLTDDMAREFGDMVKEHMPAIWTRANEMLDNITAKVPDPVKRIVRKQGLDEQKQVFIENIKEKAAKGEKKSFNWYVQKMARELYKSGITERDDLINALHGLLKQAVPDITLRQTQDAFSGYGDYKPLSKNEITVALRGMKGELQQIAKLEDMEKGKPPLKSGMERRTPTEVERKLIKLVNDAKNKFQVPVSDPETQLKSALDTLKTTLENRIKDYADRLARKDFSPRPRREIVLDSRANQLKVEAERIKKRFREELIADRLKNRNPWEKVMDWGTKLRRFDILSSPVVIPKLISAGIQRLTSLPLEEEVGGVFKRIPGYKQVFEKAPLEGGGRNLSAEMVGFKSAFMKGLKDAYDVLKTGHSELDVLYGKAGESYTGEFELMSKLLAMPGRIHGMIKAPVKRATFERAVERYAKHYLSQGIPVDDVLKTRIALDAYKAANRSIFLNDNRIALAFNAALRTAEQPLKETGHPTAGGKALATLGRITIPIVKVPLNIVAETMQYATGLVSGNVRLANAFRRGIETLTPEQADLIARELKKGSIGAAILMLGYANADAIGGYYQPGTKKKPGQPKWGSINVFGVNVPSFLLHNPLLETLQIGATIRQVADSKLKKRDKTTQGLSEGVLAAAFGVVEQTPFMREMAEIEKLRNPYTRDRFFGEQAKSLVVPAMVSKAAEWMDPLNPNLQRKSRTTTEYIKSGIPGLRQQLPAERKK